MPVHTIETIVVTAERAAESVASSAASVSVLRKERLERLPVRTLAGALGSLPGFSFLDFDGQGYAPQAVVRGFYGGGETDYVLLLLDGRPVNTLETGSLDWELLPLVGVESVEVIRGGASSLYGDAAIGGVVNVVTRGPAPGGGRLSVAGGSLGSLVVRGRADGQLSGRRASAFGGVESTDGDRSHAGRTFGSAGGTVDLVAREERGLTLSALGHWSGVDDPGPLPGDELALSRTASTPFFRFDHTDERRLRVALDGTATPASGARHAASLSLEHRSVDQVRTLPLSPEFADTKSREIRATTLSSSVQTTLPGVLLDSDRLTVGVDASAGFLDSRYYRMVTGGMDAYASADGERGELDARGDGRRRAGAVFLQYDWRPVPRLRLVAGGRYDRIHDSFEPAVPSDAESTASDHSAFSPKVGVNLRYTGEGSHLGHLYANVTRSFKAPTLDQLYDQRSTPVPFPPFSITTSNPELEPQDGTSVEVGAYHRVEGLSGLLSVELTLSVYRMDMENELDFDLTAYRYVNVGRSRHDGIEAGLSVDLGGRLALFLNAARQDVTARSGENDGKRLKAIPRDVLSGGIMAVDPSGLGLTVTVHRLSGMFLDDANTATLPHYATLDGRLSWETGGRLSLFAEAFNLLDETYSSTGFPDPAGSGVVYYQPAAGRTVRLGAELSW